MTTVTHEMEESIPSFSRTLNKFSGKKNCHQQKTEKSIQGMFYFNSILHWEEKSNKVVEKRFELMSVSVLTLSLTAP